MKIGEYLVEKGLLTEDDIVAALGEKFKLPFIDLRNFSISEKALGLFPEEVVLRHKVLPISIRGTSLLVVTWGQPVFSELMDELAQYTNKHVNLVLTRPAQLEEAINKFYVYWRMKNPPGEPSPAA